MSERKNLKLRASLYRRLKDDKGPHMSWPDYFRAECLGDDLRTPDDDTDSVDTEALAEILEAAHTIEERTGRIESTLDELQR